MQKRDITIRGARVHNLKNITLNIPRDKLVVITGLSGSGKSSLAFDTLYAEGQRRYVESLSAYARQFLEQMEKPDVDHIEGLSPAIAIQHKAPGHNPRSTVGTVTEIYDYLRLFFARIGVPHCPKCGRRIQPQSASQIVETIQRFPSGTKIQVLAPMVRGRKGEYRELFSRLRHDGYARVRVDGKIYHLEENIRIDRQKKHNIETLIDRLQVSDRESERLIDAVEIALRLGEGLVCVRIDGDKNPEEIMMSRHHACLDCGISLGEIEPRLFSFNSPYGACAGCSGLGNKFEVDPEFVVPDHSLSVHEGAIVPWSDPVTTRRHRWKNAWSGWYTQLVEKAARAYGIDLDKPFGRLTKKNRDILLYGAGTDSGEPFEGVISNLKRRYNETESEYVREEIMNRYMRSRVCPTCKGARLKKEALSVLVKGRNIAQISADTVREAQDFFRRIELTDKERAIGARIIKEIRNRLLFLENVGLDYLSIDRESSTLSGGEAQRIHLATQIGSSLVGVLYILDEPSVGLHQRDNARLLDTLRQLRDAGNTVLVVEHDRETIEHADWIIDLGPGAGIHGGHIVEQGTVDVLRKNPRSLTGQYLRGTLSIPVPASRRKSRQALVVRGASHFNLKNIDVKFPLGLFVAVTGVSGSGKSTLVYEVLYKTLARRIYHSKDIPGICKRVENTQLIDKVVLVDQSPIGRTPRSNPVTYTKTFDLIRELFGKVALSRERGYKQGRFSFNVRGGRCEGCTGDGLVKIEMQFLPDVYIHCEECGGNRFNKETLDVRYKGKNIAEVLDMTAEEALDFFKNIPKIRHKLQTLYDVGLEYINLGQSATTLSGGEAQRIKLSRELSKRATGRTLYILDEPTTGLHFADIRKLLAVLHRLVEKGNTVIVIEHNLDVIKTADYVIDLGPEGGARGGEVIAWGTPEDVMGNPDSLTGRYLKRYVKNPQNLYNAKDTV